VANEEATHTFVYRVSENGRTATKLLDDAGGADVRPSGAGKAIAHLSLGHRWLSQTGLELSGRLTVAGHGTVGRRVVLGRLGKTLPTERLRTVMTGTDGRFRLRLGVRNRRRWRVATAFFRGSRREWSTTAFASLAP
jgi:hypothetical protein